VKTLSVACGVDDLDTAVGFLSTRFVNQLITLKCINQHTMLMSADNQ